MASKNERKIEVLSVIPARGGSKGIPRKNLKILNGRPLIFYSINTSINSKYVTDTVVTTDDEEIYEISKIYEAIPLKRPKKLAEDDVTLDPVVYHATTEIEKKYNKKYDYVITIQATSPLLSVRTLDSAIEKCINEDMDTIIASKEERHLYWKKNGNSFIPMYKERKNRQFLEPIFKETGSFVITKREFVKRNSRFGEKISLFPIPEEESIDIDSEEDWWIAENRMKSLKIIIRVDGDKKMGMGHIYRSITLAHRLSLYHEVMFAVEEDKTDAIKKIESTNYKMFLFKNNDELYEHLKMMDADIIINDILDTDADYIKKLKKLGYFVVNFEDLGDGADEADIVINALYENTNPPKNHYFGYRYVCLRDEFRIFPPKEIISKDVKKILLIFGGSDPNNVTVRSLNAIKHLGIKEVSISVIVGPAYSHSKDLETTVEDLKNSGFDISVKNDVKIVAKEMRDSDIVLTSNGRTVYEVASLGVPCISISQNERESRHLFVHTCRCVKYIGMAENVDENKISEAIKKLMESYELRKAMREKMLKFDIKNGLDRVVKVILESYWNSNKR